MFPKVKEVLPNRDYTVEVRFDDGKVVRYDASSLLNRGRCTALKDLDIFMSRCMVMNHTLAWDISGNRDETECIDIAPDTLYALDEIK